MAASNASSLACYLRWMLSAKQNSEISDSQLVESYLKEQDDIAFASLVRRHGQLVLGVCRRVLRHAQDAEDVFQATFLLLARKAGSIRRREAVGSWLYQTAYRLAHKMRLRAQQQHALEQKAGSPSAADTVADVSWREVREILDEEMARLPEKNRAPLLLCYWEGRTQDEAARQLGWPVRTLQARLTRGREVLRGRLARRGLPFGSALAATMLAGDCALAHVPTQIAVDACAAASKCASGEALTAAVSTSVAGMVKGAMKEMVIAKIQKVLLAAVLCASVVGASVGYLVGRAAPADDEAAPQAVVPVVARKQQPQKDDNASKQVSYAVNNRSARDLAALLEKHFHGVAGVQIVPNGPENKLLLTARPGDLAELLNTLAKLDRRPQEVAVQILLLRMPASNQADAKLQPVDFDVQKLSGPAERVLGSIDAWQRKGVFTAVDRYQLKTMENQTANLDHPTNAPYVTATTVKNGAGDKPLLTRSVSYKMVGTSFTVKALVGPDNVILLDLHTDDARAQESDAVPLASIQNGEAVRATEFNVGDLESRITIPSGHAVLVKDAQLTSKKAGERILIVVTAQTVQ